MFSQINVVYPKPALTNAGTAVADASLTVSTGVSTPAVFTAASAGGSGVNLIYFDVTLANVRARWDGTNPSGTVGHFLPLNTAYIWPVAQWNSCKFIRDTGATVDAVVYCSAMNV